MNVNSPNNKKKTYKESKKKKKNSKNLKESQSIETKDWTGSKAIDC